MPVAVMPLVWPEYVPLPWSVMNTVKGVKPAGPDATLTSTVAPPTVRLLPLESLAWTEMANGVLTVPCVTSAPVATERPLATGTVPTGW